MRLLKHIRPFFRWKKPANPTEDFLSVLKAIDAMEKEGKLLVSDDDERPGIVLNHELAQYFLLCYLTRMQHYASRYGIELFFKARHFISSFASKHNPDEELLNLCRNVRMVINFRRAALVKQMDEDWSELKPGEPLYITFMNSELTKPTHIGFEKNEEITIEPVK